MATTSLALKQSTGEVSIQRWLYGAIVLLVISIGWIFPYMGLIVPVVMVTGMIGGFFRGRYVCGNLCPRGSFLDTWMARFANRREVPGWMRSHWFRGIIMTVLMGFLGWRLAQDIGSLEHWGFVFWQMCALTTLFAVAMGLVFRERAWCTICPMGSVQAMESRGQYSLRISDTCRTCQACENVCPMNLPVTAYLGVGEVKHPDCIKCSRCVKGCPVAALSWPR